MAVWCLVASPGKTTTGKLLHLNSAQRYLVQFPTGVKVLTISYVTRSMADLDLSKHL